jgi:hypothetical protein
MTPRAILQGPDYATGGKQSGEEEAQVDQVGAQEKAPIEERQGTDDS